MDQPVPEPDDLHPGNVRIQTALLLIRSSSRFTHYLEKSHKRKVELTVSINNSPASAPDHGNGLAGMVEHMPKPDMVSMRLHIPSPIQQ